MKQDRITNVLLSVLIVLIIALIFLQLKSSEDINLRVESAISDINISAGSDGYTPIKGIDYFDGNTPVKGIDYVDGLSGSDGSDGDSAYESWLKLGNSGTEEDFIASLKGESGNNGSDGKDGMPGLTQEIRCNDIRNRWEYRFKGENWQIQYGSSGNPVRCVAQ